MTRFGRGFLGGFGEGVLFTLLFRIFLIGRPWAVALLLVLALLLLEGAGQRAGGVPEHLIR